MALNPFARPFEPGAGCQAVELTVPLIPQEPFPLEQLPLGVLDQVLCCLASPADVAACLVVNKALQQQASQAFLSILSAHFLCVHDRTCPPLLVVIVLCSAMAGGRCSAGSGRGGQVRRVEPQY